MNKKIGTKLRLKQLEDQLTYLKQKLNE